MSTNAKTAKPKYEPTHVLVIGALIVVAGILFGRYFTAAREGFEHYHKSEFTRLALNFEAKETEAEKVPDFTLKDRGGRPIKLSQFDSIDVLIVNIWSSGCPVCREEIPALTELDRRLEDEDGMALLTIAVADQWKEVASYFPKGTNLRILFDEEDAVGGGIFKTDKYPETFILDKQRRIRARFDGARRWHSDAFIRYAKSFL